MVGGRIWWRRARTLMPASSPPAPPSRWPVMDLVELTATLEACSPNARLTATVSMASPSGVEVPWALTYPTCCGCTLASRRAAHITRKAPSPSPAGWGVWAGGLGDVVGIAGHAIADNLREYGGAAALRVLERFQDDDAGAFADHEAVALGVKRTAGAQGIIIARGGRLHGGKSADGQGRH